MRARFELADLGAPDEARRDFESALALDPNNVRLRLDFARELKAMSGSHPKLIEPALLEYDLALGMNNLLNPHEIKRLTKKELAQCRRTSRSWNDVRRLHNSVLRCLRCLCFDDSAETLSQATAGDIQVIVHLQSQPKLRRIAEVSCQTK